MVILLEWRAINYRIRVVKTQDLTICRQNNLIQRKKTQVSSSKENQKKVKSDRKGGRYNTHPTNQRICSFCSEGVHLATNGSANNKIIQYFSCEMFVWKKLQTRFPDLQKKKKCFLCLYSESGRDKVKHGAGHFQRIFTCQDKRHDKYMQREAPAQAFIQALLSTAVFSQKIEFFYCLLSQ